MAGENVLLVDASDKIIEQLSDALKKMGYQVDSVQWAEEALTIIQDGNVDAVLIRTNLPGMNAVQFVHDLRRKTQFQIRPVILVYGKEDKAMLINSLKSGADDVITLPFSMPEMLLRLDLRLRKTINDGEIVADSLISTDMQQELELASSFPPRGALASRSIPMLMATIFLRNDTGVLRVIHKKVVRTYYFESGHLRSATSSEKSENLGKMLEKWQVLTGDVRKKFRSWGKLTSDKAIIDTVLKITSIEPAQVIGLAARYIQFISATGLKLKEGDYDWVERETPSDMFMMDARGLNPAIVITTALRVMLFKPAFKEFQPKDFDWIVPNGRQGILRELYQLTPQEAAMVSLTESGANYNELLRDARQILPYTGALIHVLLSFKGLQIVDKRATTLDEVRSVAFEKIEKQMPSIVDAILDDENEEAIIDAAAPMKKADPTQSPAQKKKPVKPVADIPGEKEKTPAKSQATRSKSVETPVKPKSTAPPVKPKSTAPPVKKKSTVPSEKPEISHSAPKPVKPRDVSPPAGSAPTIIRPTPQAEDQSRIPESPAVEEEEKKVRELFPVDPSKKSESDVRSVGPHAFGFRISQVKEGSIKDVPGVFIFALTMMSGKTGVLTVQGDVFEFKLFFKNGRLLFARSTDPNLRVDQIMVDMNMITPEQKAEVEKMIAEMGKMRSGTLIFQHQLVNMVQLSDAIHRQINLILTKIFTLQSGDFKFEEGSLPDEEHIPFDLSGASLLVSCVRDMENYDALESHFPKMNDKFVQTHEGRDLLNQYRLGSHVAAVFDKFRKPIPLKEAVVGASISLKEYKGILLALVTLGLLNPVD